MMDPNTIFAVKLVASFLVGGAFVAAVTVISERIGGVLGGVISGVPAGLAVSLFFQALLLGSVGVVEEVVPAAFVSLGIFGYFLVGYIVCLRWGRFAAFFGGIVLWFCVALACSFIPLHSVFIGMFLCFAFGGICFAVLRNIPVPFQKEARQKVLVSYSMWQLGLRFLFGGMIVMLSVWVNQIISPKWGGLLSGFPTMGVTNLLILAVTMGSAYTGVFAKSYFSSAMINVFIYIFAVSVFYPLFGLWWGTLLAFIPAVLSTFIVYKFRQGRLMEAHA